MSSREKRRHWDTVVIGAGASGLMAAVSASANGGSGHKTAVLERNERPGRKLLATGNGRCNYTNVNCLWEDLGSFSKEALQAFSPAETVDFFQGLGVHPRVEEEGRVYPYSGQGAAVLDALLEKTQREAVEILCKRTVKSVTIEGDCFLLTTEEGERFSASKVILATSGKAGIQYGSTGQGYKIAESLGHTVVKPVPALTGLICPKELCGGLKGVRAKGAVSLLKEGTVIAQDEGEIQFTEEGVSGICVFNVSKHIRYERGSLPDYQVSLNLIPELTEEQVLQTLLKRRQSLRERSQDRFLYGLLHQKLSSAVIKSVDGCGGEKPAAGLTDRQIAALAALLKNWRFPVLGTKSWKEAQVTSGGVCTDEIFEDRMESKLVSGLYFAGEVIDVDGRCGGYNLQWAWSSGWLAGKAAAQASGRP